MEFDWDNSKAESNLKKHGVSFPEAESVFGDWLAITAYDPKHSDSEDRYLTIGTSADGRLLLISHTYRGETIRIISARVASRRERKDYEDGRFP